MLTIDRMVAETPTRKRSRSETPSSASSRYVNKRLCQGTLTSPSPKTVHFDPINPEEDAVLESDVPESPITPGKQTAGVSVSFAPNTPMSEISDPFAKLN